MILNQLLSGIQNSATVSLSDRIRKLKATGKSIISLQTGDPDFATPRPIIEAAYEAINKGHTHYSFSNGIPELRKAIGEKIENETGVYYDPETEILITNGGIHALYCSLAAIINKGDEVVVQNPSWMPYKSVIEILGGIARTIETRAENNFFAPVAEIERQINSKTKALIINSPNNPTGMVASMEYLQSISELAGRCGLIVITDEVYRSISFDGKTAGSFLSTTDAKAKSILIDSFSKSFAMTGWRLGYVASTKEIITQIQKSVQYTITNVPVFVQYGGVAALKDKEVKPLVQKMYQAYEQRRNMVKGIFNTHKHSRIKMILPEGAFYIFCDISALGITSIRFSESVLESKQVAVVPGSVYGPAGEGFVRITIAAAEDDISAGVNAILNWSEIAR